MVSGTTPPELEQAAADKLAMRVSARVTPRRCRGHQEFAERYVRLASGPYRGHSFRVARQPFTGLLFRELDSTNWPTVIVSGPSQSSKTLSAFVIPTLRDIIELGEDPLIGVPEADMAQDKWDRDFVPTLEASPELKHLLPKTGPGSRGGRVKDRITLGNGSELKIMSRGGQDTAKAGYTACRVRVTEAAGWSHASETSSEADPLRQLKARLRSFRRKDPRRSLVVEGTLTVPDELPWRARGEDDDDLLISTRSRIECPCVHCGDFVLPERQHLRGWQEATSEDQAANQAYYVCPSCGHPIFDDDRRTMLADCVLVHYGQTVDKQGNIQGDSPPTSTLWFAWQSWHNMLLDIGDFAVEEWRASQAEEGTAERENAEKELCQFVHGVCFRSALTPDEPVKSTTVRHRKSDAFPRGVLPPDTERVTIGVDIGDWTLWWFALAGRADGSLHCPGYGAIDVKRRESDDLTARIEHALEEFRATICEVGFAKPGAKNLVLPSEVWIDIGYRPEDITSVVRNWGGLWTSKYKCARGRGVCRRNRINQGHYSHPRRVTTKTPRIGTQWYAEPNWKRRIAEYTFNADYWKVQVIETLRAKAGGRGSLVLYQAASTQEHIRVSNHLCSEQLEMVWDAKKGLVQQWVKRGQNHYQDCCAMALAALDSAGWRIRDTPAGEDEAEEAQPEAPTNFYAAARARA